MQVVGLTLWWVQWPRGMCEHRQMVYPESPAHLSTLMPSVSSRESTDN